jgi:hypothetical protein
VPAAWPTFIAISGVINPALLRPLMPSVPKYLRAIFVPAVLRVHIDFSALLSLSLA